MRIMTSSPQEDREDIFFVLKGDFTVENHGLLYLHGLALRILKKKIVGQIFERSFA